MRQAVLLLFLFLWLCNSFGDIRSEAQQQTLDPNEEAALVEIGKKLKVTFWNFSTDPCSNTEEWQQISDDGGVRNVTCGNCSASNVCHVVSIQLKSQNLTGVIPEELANLTHLTQIDFTRNYIRGTIPAALASLPLEILSLIGNRLWGPIPNEIGNIQTLNSLVLENNILEGPLPSSLGKLNNLTRLLLSANKFTGELPDSLGELSNLNDIRIDGNAFTGNIPSFFENLTSLTRFDMQGTSLKGPFPPNFSNLKGLEQLTVTDVNIGGTFPPFEDMNFLRLTLRNCSLSGELPSYIGDMKLKKLDVSFNNFSGKIPSNFEKLTETVNNIYLTNNMLSGSIPSWILNSKQSFDLSYNSFNESAPGFCHAGNLNLVSSYGSSEVKSMNTSCLRKNLPCTGKAANYKLFINCGGPAKTIGDEKYEPDVQTLGTSNYYSSPNRRWGFSSTGDFLGEAKAKHITANVSALTNTTDPDLYMSARLTAISLRYYGFCLQKGNYTVNLHFAEIMFTDDETFASNGRRIFDVSIQGEKVLRDFNISKEANGTGKGIIRSFFAHVDENSGSTLEIHFQWLGKGTNAIPERGVYGPLISAISITPNFKPYQDETKLSNGAIAGIAVGSFVPVFLVGVILFFYIRKKKKADRDRRALEVYTGYFSLKQIKSATQNFAPENKVGEGGFGSVYKGVLDGCFIAVKQLSSKSKQGNREFVNEIGIISASQHPNLVKLLGCCVEGNQLLLVYEYMENNSLASALFSPEGVKLNLDWKTRCKICIGIAKGLTYLHEESVIKIVHRDIKATNVLLDKNLVAKISDFGLAKLDVDEYSHISTRIAGTAGYMAPEYAMRGYLTDKADVYSFGIVLLELISGKSNTNYRPKDEFVYLLDWAYVLKEEENLLELVDPCLGSNYSKKEAQDMLNLALLCASPSPTLRPKMSVVTSMLEGRTPITLASMKHLTRTPSEVLRFKAFENISNDSLSTMGLMSDTSWSISNNNMQGSTTDQDAASATHSKTEKNLLD